MFGRIGSYVQGEECVFVPGGSYKERNVFLCRTVWKSPNSFGIGENRYESQWVSQTFAESQVAVFFGI